MSYEEYTVKIHSNGDKLWYQNDKLHRLDAPAIEYATGTKFWYQNGHQHRLDGPALEYADGAKYWYQNDKRHRLDGPAIEYATGYKEWWIEGKQYSKEAFEQMNNPTKEMTVEQIAKELGYKVKVV